jgi:uncharacterized membrane protein
MMLIVVIGLVMVVVTVGILIYVTGILPLHRAVDQEPDEDEALLALRERYEEGELTETEYERLVAGLRQDDELDETGGTSR